MRGIVIRWLTLTIAIMIASYLIEGIVVRGFFSALGAAAVLGILNAFLRPMALLLTLPLNVLTLGLFTFAVNAVILMMAAALSGSIEVHGFWTAVLGSLIISLVSWVLNVFIGEKGRVDVIDLRQRGDGRWE